jgi:DNA-binding transcriptional ArsR family regulator
MVKQPPEGGAPPPRDTRTVTDLEQIRALADPLRLRILGSLTGAPRTTKQVAELLGEKPTKLYHHVEALERAGLIRLHETRPKRGTVERYYQAVAARFQVAASALCPPGAGDSGGELEAMVSSILDTARGELLASCRPRGPAGVDPAEAPLVARVLIRGTGKKVQAVRRRVLRWIEKLRAEGEGQRAGDPAEETCTLTVVFCRTGPG